MNRQIPTEGTVDRELQSALDYACALGRMAGGHGPEVIWNVGSQSRNGKAESGKGTIAGAKLQALTKALNQTKGNKTKAAKILGVRRSTVSEWCAKLALCVLLVGCATPKAETLKPETLKRDGPPLPPLPVASAERNSRPATMTATAAAIAPQPPRISTISLAWDKNHPGAITEVWSGPTIFNRTVNLRTNVQGDRVTLPCDQPAEFYRIRNRVGEAVSRWNDEGQP